MSETSPAPEAEAEPEAEPVYSPENCIYLQGCRWGSGCPAEGTCIGTEVER